MTHPFASRLAVPALASVLLAGPGDDVARPQPLAEGAELDLFREVGYELDFELSSEGQWLPGFEMGYERVTEKTITVLASDEDGPRAIHVVYHAVDEVGEGPGIDGDGDDGTPPSPLDGAVVEVRRDGRGWAVSDGDGDAVTDALAEVVLDEEVRRDQLLFELRMFAAVAARGGLEEGDSVDVDEELAIELLDGALDEDGGVFEEAEMVLGLVERRAHPESGATCAVFDVDLIANGEIPGDLEVAVELSGGLWLDLGTGCTAELELEGEMAVSGDAEDAYGVELDGEGRLRIALRAL